MAARTQIGCLINSEWRKHQRTGAEQAVVSRPQEVSTDSEEILHDTVNRREPTRAFVEWDAVTCAC